LPHILFGMGAIGCASVADDNSESSPKICGGLIDYAAERLASHANYKHRRVTIPASRMAVCIAYPRLIYVGYIRNGQTIFVWSVRKETADECVDY
jgi:hypothetical protein